ncbi:DegT/DnrJ/EryC1/StrS family aminotransferase [Methylosinus sporium]|uniref:DegT/DnrJ/EryC1/StrS family aminotransferase n=1 Tax=Methylosinus sporium TaxID=428 RepID=UPI002484D153|nr:DegT/DnrJ/EryC1/StrS family aminotransferase [Methylosinus sporium]
MLDGNEMQYVRECLESTWISSHGKFIDAFERRFAELCGVEHAIACNNGTTALHLALVSLGVGAGDEIIVPDLTYVATANCVRYCNADPVFVDCEPRTFNIDPAAIEAKITPRTKGIIVVHLFGQPCDMDEIQKIADAHGLFIVEDAAEAHGAKYKGRPVGSLGKCATFSFFGNKIVTTGEGGAVVTDDDELASRLRLLRGQGMDPERRYWFPVIGYNYRMTNIAAAIGLAQLERVDRALAFRRRLSAWYDEALADVDVIRPYVEPWAEHSFWMYTIKMAPHPAPS